MPLRRLSAPVPVVSANAGGPSRRRLEEKPAQEAREEEDTVGADQQWRPAWSRTVARGGEPSNRDELLCPE
jgi:hypothetical protein